MRLIVCCLLRNLKKYNLLGIICLWDTLCEYKGNRDRGVQKMGISKKHIGSSIALLIICLLMVPFQCATAADVNAFAIVTNDTYVNLRNGPGTNFQVIGSYRKGEWVEVIGESDNWYYVQGPDGKLGYASMTYLSKGSTSNHTIAIVNNAKASAFLNMRETPSYNARVLSIFYNGVPLYVDSHSNGWYGVSINNMAGYVRQEFVRIIHAPASSSVSTIVTPNNTKLNLRNGPGTQYGVSKQCLGGGYVMVLLKGSSWSKVSVDGVTGYMDNRFLREGLSGNGGQTGIKYGIVRNPISTQLLNMRETPSLQARVIGRYMNGTRVTILKQGEEWCEVRVDKTHTTGFMMTKYLALYNVANVPYSTVSHPMRTYVNLRKSMSINSSVLMRIPHGQQVEVLAPGKNWYKVKYNGKSGYIVASFLK